MQHIFETNHRIQILKIKTGVKISWNRPTTDYALFPLPEGLMGCKNVSGVKLCFLCSSTPSDSVMDLITLVSRHEQKLFNNQ